MYISLIVGMVRNFKIEIWAYCLMLNHIHKITVSKSEKGLRSAFRERAICREA